MATINLEPIRRHALPAGVALVIGAVGWFGLRTLLFTTEEEVPDAALAPVAEAAAAEQPPPEAPVVYPNILVAKTNVEAGVMLAAEMVEWIEWRDGLEFFDEAVVEDKVPLAAIVGAVTMRPVVLGAPITWEAILMPGHPGFVSAVLGTGMLGITVEVDRATTSANIIYPGDRVDVIVSMSDDDGVDGSRTVLRHVRVLAVGSMVMSPGRYGTVSVAEGGIVEPPPLPKGDNYTLEVTPKGAESLALTSTKGRLTLAMRASGPQRRAVRPSAAPVRLAEVMPPQPKEPKRVVRVIRGASGAAS